MSSGFITEAEIEQKRKLRQEQWEKVRKPEEPLEVPEEPKDNRSLFERLQEQKNKKQEDFEEAHKLKNLVKTLDDEEVQFLDYVDQQRHEEDKRKRLEEAKELSEFRTAVSELREKEFEKALQEEIGIGERPKHTTKAKLPDPPSIGIKKTSQTQLLAGLVKRKSLTNTEASSDTSAAKKAKLEAESSANTSVDTGSDSEVAGESTGIIESIPHKGSLVCIGVLPGLSSYADSSDDEDDGHVHDNCCSSDFGRPKGQFTDLCGRKLQFVEKEEKK